MISFTKGTTFCGNVQACRERKWSSISALAALCLWAIHLGKESGDFLSRCAGFTAFERFLGTP